MTGILQRLFDLVLSSVLLILAAVPMLFIALAIKMHDGGPALFRQQRVGQHCRPFEILKFRTMRVDRERTGDGACPREGESLVEANARFQRTIPGDPRITPIGKVLRPSHLDELPQLLNILRGDMSFVGVRPDTPVQEADYDAAFWHARHRYKPGLTGPAQLETCETLDKRNALEEVWLEGRSMTRYFAALAMTVVKVFKRSSL